MPDRSTWEAATRCRVGDKSETPCLVEDIIGERV
jgi:hypothetical protein